MLEICIGFTVVLQSSASLGADKSGPPYTYTEVKMKIKMHYLKNTKKQITQSLEKHLFGRVDTN